MGTIYLRIFFFSLLLVPFSPPPTISRHLSPLIKPPAHHLKPIKPIMTVITVVQTPLPDRKAGLDFGQVAFCKKKAVVVYMALSDQYFQKKGC